MIPSRTLSPAIGFACGWAFWFRFPPRKNPCLCSCVTIVPNEAVAMKDIMYYWTPAQKVPEPVWIAVFIFLPFAFNFLNVRRYGEVEYWLTMIKIITLVTLFFLGVVFLPLGINPDGPWLGINGINGTEPVPCSKINNGTCLEDPGFNCMSLRISLTVDWREQPFQNLIVTGPSAGLVSFWECCCRAIFGYIGLLAFGITAVETENPRENLPKASRKAGRRIVLYYVLASLALSLNLSAKDPILLASLTRKLPDPPINYG